MTESLHKATITNYHYICKNMTVVIMKTSSQLIVFKYTSLIGAWVEAFKRLVIPYKMFCWSEMWNVINPRIEITYFSKMPSVVHRLHTSNEWTSNLHIITDCWWSVRQLRYLHYHIHLGRLNYRITVWFFNDCAQFPHFTSRSWFMMRLCV